MEPDAIKKQIRSEYVKMVQGAQRGEINQSCIFRIIEARAREGARHGGIPECWREYMPVELADL